MLLLLPPPLPSLYCSVSGDPTKGCPLFPSLEAVVLIYLLMILIWSSLFYHGFLHVLTCRILDRWWILEGKKMLAFKDPLRHVRLWQSAAFHHVRALPCFFQHAAAMRNAALFVGGKFVSVDSGFPKNWLSSRLERASRRPRPECVLGGGYQP